MCIHISIFEIINSMHILFDGQWLQYETHKRRATYNMGIAASVAGRCNLQL